MSRVDSGDDPDSGYVDLPADFAPNAPEETRAAHGDAAGNVEGRGDDGGLGFGFGEKPDYGRELFTDMGAANENYIHESDVNGGSDLIKVMYDDEDAKADYNHEIAVNGGADMIKSLYDQEDSNIREFGLGNNAPDIPQLPMHLEMYKQQTQQENQLEFDQRRRDTKVETYSRSAGNPGHRGMFGQVDGGMFSQVDGGMFSQVDGGMFGQTNRGMFDQTDGGMFGQTDGGMFSQTTEGGMFNKTPTPERAKSSREVLHHKMNKESGDWLGLSAGVRMEEKERRRSTGNALDDEETRQKWTVQRPKSQRPRDNLQLAGSMDWNVDRNVRGQTQRDSSLSAGFVPRERGDKRDKYSRDNLKSASNAKFTAEPTSKDYKKFSEVSSGGDLRATPSWYVAPKPSKKAL